MSEQRDGDRPLRERTAREYLQELAVRLNGMPDAPSWGGDAIEVLTADMEAYGVDVLRGLPDDGEDDGEDAGTWKVLPDGSIQNERTGDIQWRGERPEVLTDEELDDRLAKRYMGIPQYGEES